MSLPNKRTPGTYPGAVLLSDYEVLLKTSRLFERCRWVVSTRNISQKNRSIENKIIEVFMSWDLV